MNRTLLFYQDTSQVRVSQKKSIKKYSVKINTRVLLHNGLKIQDVPDIVCSMIPSVSQITIARVRYSNILTWLRGFRVKIENSFFLALYYQKRLGYKENNTNYGSLFWKPRSHVGILIYRMWTIGILLHYHQNKFIELSFVKNARR